MKVNILHVVYLSFNILKTNIINIDIKQYMLSIKFYTIAILFIFNKYLYVIFYTI